MYSDSHFHAKITFRDAQQGGRFTPPSAGFHPQMQIGSKFTSCIVTPLRDEIEVFSFGQEYEVSLTLPFIKEIKFDLQEGDSVLLYEGSKKIGEGHIVGRRRKVDTPIFGG